MTKKATKLFMQNYPIVNPKRIEIDMHFTDKQFFKLTMGLMPQQMEDKWFIFFENNWLYFHRSWTGFCIFKTQLIKEKEGYYIKEFWAERNLDKYTNDDDNIDIENISFLILNGLLETDVSEIYSKKNLKLDENIINVWSKFGNMMLPNQNVGFINRIKAYLFSVVGKQER